MTTNQHHIQDYKQKRKMKNQDPEKLIYHKHNIKYNSDFVPANHPTLFLKYFGKKVTLIKKPSDLTRALNLSKHFINVDLSNNLLQPYSLKTKNNNVVCLKDVKFAPHQIKRIFMACKGSVKIKDSKDFSEEILFRLTRLYLRETKQISFDWTYCNKITFSNRALASLRRLEKLTISVHNGLLPNHDENYRISDDYEASNMIRLVENITKLPNLKTLYLDFYGIEVSADLVVNLTLLVANSKIEDWYLDVIIPIEFFKDMDILKPALEKVQTLGIFKMYSYWVTNKIKKVQNQHEKSKILCLYLRDHQNDHQINLYSILRHCTSLRTLMIGTNSSESIYIEQDFSFQIKDQPIENTELTKASEATTQWARNLYSAVLFYPSDKRKLSEKSSLMEIINIIKKESKNIKILNVYNSKNLMIYQKNMKIDSFESYNLVCDQLLGIKTLEKASISLQTIDHQYLKKLMFSAENLMTLKLKLSHPNFANYWDDDLPFAQFINLKELKISFHGLLEGGLWGDNLASQITTLKNLEVLSIKTRKNWKMFLTKFCIFLNNTATLPNLKVLRLNTKIVQTLKRNHCLNDPGFVLFDLIKGTFDALEIMVYSRRNIELLQIEEFEDFETKSFFYKRHPISSVF